MIGPGTGVRVYLVRGVTDMRKGITGLFAPFGNRPAIHPRWHKRDCSAGARGRGRAANRR